MYRGSGLGDERILSTSSDARIFILFLMNVLHVILFICYLMTLTVEKKDKAMYVNIYNVG